MAAANWLLSSAGRRGHLVMILRETCVEMGGGGVIAIDASPLSAAGLLADKFEVVPQADDPAFIDHVLDICDRHSIQHVIPTVDPELLVYAAARARFEAHGCQAWVSSPDVVALGTDKWLLHNWLTAHDFSVPDTVEVRNPAVASLEGPVFAKPRSGSSSIGLTRGDSVSSLRLDALSDDFIVQCLAPGYEVTVDFAVDASGRLRGMGARRRIEVRAGEVSKAVTIDHKRLRSEIERFAAQLPGPFGVLNVQVFVDDESNSVYFIELNPRFGGGYPLSWQAGARFPPLLAETEQADFLRQDARPGVVMLRFDQAVFEDAAYFGDALP
jgi:carbamoyl-phosphate synthase large subunit